MARNATVRQLFNPKTFPRQFSTFSPRYQRNSSDHPEGHKASPPKAPKGLEDSTSALSYKLTHRARPPALPVIDPPRWSAEEAVTNILCVLVLIFAQSRVFICKAHSYNTPPPSNQPFTRHVLNCLVQNEPGVLSRVSGILAARGFKWVLYCFYLEKRNNQRINIIVLTL